MRPMTKKEKSKYKEKVSGARQLKFGFRPEPDEDASGSLPLFVCMGKYNQYYFSRYPDDSDECAI
jgi:hypothetical protein